MQILQKYQLMLFLDTILLFSYNTCNLYKGFVLDEEKGIKAKEVTKKVVMSGKVLKLLKKTTIDLDIDNDGKFTPESYGIALEYLLMGNDAINITN